MKITWHTRDEDFSTLRNDDVTFYMGLEEDIGLEDGQTKTIRQFLGNQSARDAEVLAFADFEGDAEVFVTSGSALHICRGRAHLGACYGGAHAALTVRGEWSTTTPEQDLKERFEYLNDQDSEDERPEAAQKTPTTEPADSVASILLRDLDVLQTNYRPKSLKPPSKPEIKFLFGIDNVCEVLWKLICLDPSKPLDYGVVIVAGRTGACKSQVTRGLILQALAGVFKNIRAGQRPPRNVHVLTLEDPIEERLFSPPKIGIPFGIDYTPRQLRVDVAGIKEAIRGAKRQTPAIVYVGEVRDHSEWSEILDFAEGGHLVVVTTHAASVVECFRKLVGKEKDSPEFRSRLATLVRAIVHLRAESVELPDKRGQAEALLAAVWRRTPHSIASFVSSGFAAVLPHVVAPYRLEAPDPFEAEFGSIGRRWFARTLAAMSKSKLTDKEAANPFSPAQFDAIASDLECSAATLDLRGL